MTSAAAPTSISAIPRTVYAKLLAFSTTFDRSRANGEQLDHKDQGRVRRNVRSTWIDLPAGANKTTEWSGSGRVVACIAMRLRRGRRDLSAWRRAGDPLAGCGGAEERGWYRREPVDANRGATGQRTLKRTKEVLCVDRIYRSKIWHFLGSAARQRLLAIASAFDLDTPATRFGTVRPRVQIPGPRPFLYSKSAISESLWSQRHTAGSQFPTEQPNRGGVNGVFMGQCEIAGQRWVATKRP